MQCFTAVCKETLHGHGTNKANTTTTASPHMTRSWSCLNVTVCACTYPQQQAFLFLWHPCAQLVLNAASATTPPSQPTMSRDSMLISIQVHKPFNAQCEAKSPLALSQYVLQRSQHMVYADLLRERERFTVPHQEHISAGISSPTTASTNRNSVSSLSSCTFSKVIPFPADCHSLLTRQVILCQMSFRRRHK